MDREFLNRQLEIWRAFCGAETFFSLNCPNGLSEPAFKVTSYTAFSGPVSYLQWVAEIPDQSKIILVAEVSLISHHLSTNGTEILFPFVSFKEVHRPLFFRFLPGIDPRALLVPSSNG